MARTPTSAPGSSRIWRRAGRAAAARGFTLIELIVVVALVAVAAGMVSLSLRDGAATRLENEAGRLAALLESARAEARASGLEVNWLPARPDEAEHFRFVGLPAALKMPTRWLDDQVRAEVVGARMVPLGPEPLLGPQHIVLRLGNQRLDLVTDGLAPFSVKDVQPGPPS